MLPSTRYFQIKCILPYLLDCNDEKFYAIITSPKRVSGHRMKEAGVILFIRCTEARMIIPRIVRDRMEPARRRSRTTPTARLTRRAISFIGANGSIAQRLDFFVVGATIRNGRLGNLKLAYKFS